MENSIYLRTLEPEDVDRVYRWHNDQELYQDLIGTHHFVSRATVEKWIEKKSAFSSTEINMAICLKNNSEHIGNTYIRDINWVNRNGVIHLFIGDKEQRGKGYGKEAIKLIIEYAFQTIGLNRLYLYVFEDNSNAINLYKKAGFVVEGKLRKHVYKNGKFKDILIMGLCKSEEN
ncbi:MAG: GNAT family N-acetyltransferase [Phycisphaerae bacterium]|nr:GNAT family N-acetyltransferase [Phycisphaerae bacterium]